MAFGKQQRVIASDEGLGSLLRLWVVAHDGCGDRVGSYRIGSSDEHARLNHADALDPGPLAASDGFDAVAHVSRSLARVPWTWEVEVLLDLPVAEASQRISATLAELSDAGGCTLLRMRVGSLDWTAGVLAGLGCSFTIRAPDELRESVRGLAGRLEAAAVPTGAPTPR